MSSLFDHPLPTNAKLIPGFPDYCVTPDGVVCSRNVYGSRIRAKGPWWIMKPKQQKRYGYWYFDLFREPKKPEHFFLHRLLMLTFVGPCPEGQEVRHLDDNKKNNALANLCYGTRKQNFNDRLRNGILVTGENLWNAVLTNQEVRYIRALRESGAKYKEIGTMFHITDHYISKICRREIWTHV